MSWRWINANAIDPLRWMEIWTSIQFDNTNSHYNRNFYAKCVLCFWFFQLINIGSQYNYGNNGHSEFLCVVSREFGVSNSYKETESTDRAKVFDSHFCNLRGLFFVVFFVDAWIVSHPAFREDFYLSATNKFNNWPIIDAMAKQTDPHKIIFITSRWRKIFFIFNAKSWILLLIY